MEQTSTSDAAELQGAAFEQSKPIWKSKTFWVNAGTFIAAISGIIPERYQQFALLAQAIVNIGLRFTSEDKVTMNGK